jgi:hypothetical protein
VRRVAGVVAAALALVLAAPAGAYTDGTYKGRQDGTPLRFKVVTKKVKVGKKRVARRFVRLSGDFTSFKVECPDGFVYNTSLNHLTQVTDIRIRAKGTFALAKQLRFSGRLSGAGRKSRAAGEVSFTFPDVAEHGGDCTTGPVKWSAKRS